MIPRAVSRCSGASSSTSKIEQVHANFKSVARATSSRRSTFATSTKPVRASAAAAQVSIPTSAPAFPLPASFTGSRPSPLTVGALRSPRPFTVLPTPLPENASPIADPQYMASTVQAKLAIIDTCLFNHLDVPRAGRIFDQLRWEVLTPIPLSILNVDMHNRFLEAYFIMAEKEPEKGSYWVDRAWDLYDDMVQAKLAPSPDAETFGVALLAQMRYVSSPFSAPIVISCDNPPQPARPLRAIGQGTHRSLARYPILVCQHDHRRHRASHPIHRRRRAEVHRVLARGVARRRRSAGDHGRT